MVIRVANNSEVLPGLLWNYYATLIFLHLAINSQGIVFSFPQRKEECDSPRSNILSLCIFPFCCWMSLSEASPSLTDHSFVSRVSKQKASLHMIKGWSHFFYVVVDVILSVL